MDANFSPITLDHQLPFLLIYRCKKLYRRSFQYVASILEQLLSMDDVSSGLSADGRITLRTALGNPQHFAMNLNCCCNCLTQSNTSMIPAVITETFSQIHNNTLVYCLDGWKFGTRKRHSMDGASYRRRRNLEESCHSLSDQYRDDSLKEKKIVQDPTDLVQFPLMDFAYIYSNISHVINSTTSQVEFHLFVLVECPFTDNELRDIISKSDDEDNSYLKELWFMGAHVLTWTA